MTDGDIWVGDLVKVLGALGPADERTADAVAQLLGLAPMTARDFGPAGEEPDEAGLQGFSRRSDPRPQDAEDEAEGAAEVRIDSAAPAPNAALDIEVVLTPSARGQGTTAHPFFDAVVYPWHRADARELHRTLYAAIPTRVRIELIYRSSGSNLPPLASGAAVDMWKEVLEQLTAARCLEPFCRLLLDDPSVAAIHEVVRNIVDAREPHPVMGHRWPRVEPLEPPAAVPAVETPHEPLLDPRWQRDLAVALVAQRLPLGPVDVRSLVGRAARGLPIDRIPRKRRPSVNRGVQLLLDAAASMEPFLEDQSAFANLLRSVAGDDRVELVEFEGSPARGVVDSADGLLRAYRPPSPGVPVLVLSDLGQSGRREDVARATVQEWQEFVAKAARPASRVIALIPCSPALIPRRLRRGITIVHWTRSTGHSHIREAFNVAGERIAASLVPHEPTRGNPGQDLRALASELATLVSPAVFIEPRLLRAMRLAVVPGAGPEVESAVWFSLRVRARNPSGIVFHGHVASRLRDRLGDWWQTRPQLRPRLLEARDVLDRVHRDQSAALRLEERVAWHVVTGDVAGAERELERALEAHASGGRPGIAVWAGHAWNRLPGEVRNTRSGWVFQQLARSASGPRRMAPAERPAALRPEDISAGVEMVRDVKFGVRRRAATLELGNLSGEGAVAIMVPDTEPRTIHVRRARDREEVEIAVRAHERAVLDVGSGPVTLRTMRDDVYRLPEVESPATQTRQQATAASARRAEPSHASWGGPWPAWELNFDKDGKLRAAAFLDDPLIEQVSDLFVLVHGWNVAREAARDLYRRLLLETSRDAERTAHGEQRFGAIGVFWPARLLDEAEDEPLEREAGDQEEETPVEADLTALEGLITPQQRQRLADASKRIASRPEDAFAREEVRSVQRELEIQTARNPGDDAKSRPRGGFLQRLVGEAADLVRTTSFWTMRSRAGLIGRNGLAMALPAIAKRAPFVRLHVIAHSVGARLACHALTDLPTRGAGGGFPVKSLILLQPSLARYAFAPRLPSGEGRRGALAAVPEHVHGPVIVTHSAEDKTAGLIFEFATRLGGSDDDAPGVPPGKAMASDGAQGVPAGRARLGPVGTAYRFEPGLITNVDVSSVVKHHGDVALPEIGSMILSAARMSRPQ